jgi:hypothetical protein
MAKAKLKVTSDLASTGSGNYIKLAFNRAFTGMDDEQFRPAVLELRKQLQNVYADEVVPAFVPFIGQDAREILVGVADYPAIVARVLLWEKAARKAKKAAAVPEWLRELNEGIPDARENHRQTVRSMFG